MVAASVCGIRLIEKSAPSGPSVTRLTVRLTPLTVTDPLLAKYLAYKGSVTVNGVSLTVNRVTDGPEGADFSINLIPHTLAATTLKALRPGTAVNLEIDLIARYVERMLALR